MQKIILRAGAFLLLWLCAQIAQTETQAIVLAALLALLIINTANTLIPSKNVSD